MSNISLYIHYPFCISKCPYCDFNSYDNIKIEEDILYLSYLNEMKFYSKYAINKNVNTIYFGGGTPSLMSPNLLSKIFIIINKYFNIDKNCEITMEANPNSITLNKMNEYKNIGINRLSIGIQSLYDDGLKYLGRIHNANDNLIAISSAKKIFKDRYSIDLIYTRSDQNFKDWQIELKKAIQLSPYHISLYQLIIEKGTNFYKDKVQLPNDDIGKKFYEWSRDFLIDNGIGFYEISNFARKNYESKHNINYWNSGEWIGIGAGAHSRVNYRNKRYAIQNIKNPKQWVAKNKEGNSGISIKSILFKKEIIEEAILMGLRYKYGLNVKNLQKNGILIKDIYDIINIDNLNFLKKLKLINFTKNIIKVTKNGYLLLNSIIEKLIT